MSSCRAAIIEKFLALSPDDGVEDALDMLKKSGMDMAPVIDETGTAVGIFSLPVLMKSLLPVSVAMTGGVQLDVKIPAAPGIARRLNKVHGLSVNDVMERKFTAIDPDAPLWEGINMLVAQGSPLLVADSRTGKAAGMITNQSALDALTRLKDTE